MAIPLLGHDTIYLSFALLSCGGFAMPYVYVRETAFVNTPFDYRVISRCYVMLLDKRQRIC